VLGDCVSLSASRVLLCCCAQERYRGRAQIAFTKFDQPQVIAAELLLFDSADCIGLLWKRPVDSFSLFSRASQLPGGT
jgi:hypothetical protein